jgi:hypothetical protein
MNLSGQEILLFRVLKILNFILIKKLMLFFKRDILPFYGRMSLFITDPDT